MKMEKESEVEGRAGQGEGWEGLGSDRDGRGGNGVAIGFGSRLLPTLIPWDLSLLMGPWV